VRRGGSRGTGRGKRLRIKIRGGRGTGREGWGERGTRGKGGEVGEVKRGREGGGGRGGIVLYWERGR